MKERAAQIGFKVLFGALGFAAIVTEIVILLERGVFNPGNFFSYFTILSNIFAFIVLFIGAGYLIAKKTSKKLDMIRFGATLFMITTGIVFATLLAGLEGVSFTAAPWDNAVLHYIIPVVMVIDLLWDRVSKPITFRRGLLWLSVPVVYVIYSLIRGPIANWYPYPFLNPDNGGYLAVTITSLLIAAGGVVMVLIVTRLTRLLKR